MSDPSAEFHLVKADGAGVMESIFTYFAGPGESPQLSINQALQVRAQTA
jgi:hypothetical protein